MHKDLAKRAKRLRKLGWTVEFTTAGHVRWRTPDGRECITAGRKQMPPGSVFHALRQVDMLEQGRTVPYRGESRAAS